MATHKSTTTTTIPDFVLGVFGDDVVRFTRDELIAVRSAAFGYDDLTLFACCPSDGIMRPATADIANTWWDAGGCTYGAVPEAFAPFLEDEIDGSRERDPAADRADAWRDERVGA